MVQEHSQACDFTHLLYQCFDLYIFEVEVETPDRQLLLEIDGAMLEGLSQRFASSSFFKPLPQKHHFVGRVNVSP